MPQYATLPYYPWRLDKAWEPPLPLCCTRSHVVSWEPSLHTACLPFPPSSLCVPYCKDLLSDGHHVQAAVEVLNPLAQFFFPGSDKGKEVICSHHLVGAQKGGHLRNQAKSPQVQGQGLVQEGQLLVHPSSFSCKNVPGGGKGLALAFLGRCPEVAGPSWMGSSVPGLIGSAIDK